MLKALGKRKLDRQWSNASILKVELLLFLSIQTQPNNGQTNQRALKCVGSFVCICSLMIYQALCHLQTCSVSAWTLISAYSISPYLPWLSDIYQSRYRNLSLFLAARACSGHYLFLDIIVIIPCSLNYPRSYIFYFGQRLLFRTF